MYMLICIVRVWYICIVYQNMYTCTYSVNPTETCMPCKTCMYALQNLHDGFWDDGFWNVIKDGEPKALRRSLSPPRSASTKAP